MSLTADTRVPNACLTASVSVRTMISSKLMLIAVGAGVVNALPVLTVPDAQEDRLVDLDSPASQVSIRFLNEDSPKAVLVKYTENGVLKQLHINAHSDTASYAVDPTTEITILGDYSPYYRVCTVAPGTLKEDDDAVSTAVQWGNVPCKVSRPSPSPAPAPSPSICQSPVGMGSMPDSIWKQLPAHPSCVYAGHPFKSEGFGQCAGDPTSITLNMGVVAEKQGCYAYTTEDKKEWTMNEVSEISFDAEWEDCEGVWTAPLWLTPKTWVAPQGLSGEIDLIETCKSHAQETVGTSIICTDHPDPQCLDSQWGEAASSNGPQRFRGKIDGEGTWTMDKCSLDGTKCELVSRYPRYLTTATGPEKDMKFHFVSDLWNGGAGDSGWAACGTLNKNTKCRYTIANIKVTPKGEATP